LGFGSGDDNEISLARIEIRRLKGHGRRSVALSRIQEMTRIGIVDDSGTVVHSGRCA
jgi:hypothetical protein